MFFYAAHLGEVAFHICTALAVVLLIVFLKKYKKEYPSQERIPVIILLVIPIIVTVLYDISIINRGWLLRNWEENSRNQLIEESGKIQKKFLTLQNDYNKQSTAVIELFRASGLHKVQSTKPAFKRDAMRFLADVSEKYADSRNLSGYSLFDSDGRLVAWSGESPAEYLPFVSELENRESFFNITSDEVHSYLNSIIIIKADESDGFYILVLRRLLRSRFDIQNKFFSDYDFFEDSSSFETEIKFINADDFEAREQWEKLFYLNKDYYWGRSGEATRTLTVPLRNLSLEIIGYVSLTTPTLGEELLDILGVYRFIAETIILLALFFFVIRWLNLFMKTTRKHYLSYDISPWEKYKPAVNTILMLILFRFSFSLFGYPGRFIDLPVFQPAYFAMDIFHFSNVFLDELFNLYVSPFDLFLTVILGLVSCLIILRIFMLKASGRLVGTGKNTKELPVLRPVKSGGVLLNGLTIIFATAILLLNTLLTFLFIRSAFENSPVDILGSILINFDLTTFLIQVSFLVLSITYILVIYLVCMMLFLRFVSRKTLAFAERVIFLLTGSLLVFLIIIRPYEEIPVLWMIATTLVALIIFSFALRKIGDKRRRPVFYQLAVSFLVPLFSIISFSPLYFSVFEKQQESFIERNLVSKIEEQKRWKKILIQHSLNRYSRDRALLSKLKNREQIDIGAIAYSLWSGLDSALKGYNTALEVLTPDGDIIDRFSINPLFNQHDLTPENQGETIYLSPKWIVYDNRNVEILVGRALVKDGDRVIAQVLLSYAMDYDYILLPASRNPYYELFRSNDAEFSESNVFNKNLFLAIFDNEGNFKYASDEFSIPLDNPRLYNIGSSSVPQWLSVTTEAGAYKLYVFTEGDDTYLLGFPRLLMLDKLFYYSELVGVCFLLALVFLLVRSLFNIKSLYRKMLEEGRLSRLLRSSYIRLLVIFIVLSLIPVFYLSNFSRSHLNNKLSEEVEKRGINSLKVVKRYIDFNVLRAVIRDEETVLNVITDPLISDIGRWVNRDLNIYFGRELIATNKRELYYSRLLPTLVDNQIFMDLIYGKKIYALSDDKIGDLKYLTVSTLIKTDVENEPLIVSIPLMTEQNRISNELIAFERLILLVVVSLVMVFAFISHSLARYFARPLQRLTEGAEEIAQGNYDVKIRHKRKDEIGSLINSFNKMSDNLESQRSELFKKTKNLESILTSASSKIVSFDPEDNIITLNPAFLKFLNIDRRADDYIGKSLGELLAGNESFKYLHEAFLKYKELPEEPLHTDLRIVFEETEQSKEKELVANLVITPMMDEKNVLYASLMVIEDVTEIIKSQRLEAWAEMARIIAHEIKNPLTPIQLAAEHMQEVIKDKPKDLDEISNECLTTILGQVDVLQQISNDFSRYSRLPQLRAEPVDIGAFIKKVVSPYSVAPPEDIKIKTKIAAKTPKVLIDKKLIEQTLINLFENSFQAMPEGGELKVTLDYGKKMQALGIVGIYVADSGIGISPKILPRIFEPYFTTKDSGVGLGLAIAKKTIEEHNGSIELESEVGKGTTIKIYLKTYEGSKRKT